MAGPFDHLHIKRRTVGSSNELSFDVLDAAKSAADAKKPSKPMNITSAQGSYTGVAGTSTLSAVPEVERRKRARRNRTIRIWVIVLLAIAAVAAVGTYFGYRAYQDTLTFTGRYHALVEQLAEVDKTLVEVDRLMMNPMNSVESNDRKKVLEQFSTLKAALETMEEEVRSLRDEAKVSPDDTALVSIESAMQAREDMIASAADAFKLSEIVDKQVNVANEAWRKVLAGDSLAREATEIANKATTEAATMESRGKTRGAIELMEQARKELDNLSHEVTSVDFKPEIVYIDKRIEALNAAVATSDALLAGDRNTAIEANNEYNSADEEAAMLAAGLPASIGGTIKDQYTDQMQELIDVYQQARSQASVADGAIRAKL